MSFDKSPDAPPPRDLYQESADTLQAQVDLAPDLYAAEAEYGPKYNALTMQNLESMLLGRPASEGDPGQRGILSILQEANPQVNRMEADALSAKRASEIADLQLLGPQAVEAYDAIDPETANLKRMLTEQAQTELSQGGQLDPATLRQVTQGVRGQQALQGFGYDPMSFAGEITGVGREAEARKMQRRAFAQSVVNQNVATGLDPTMLLFNKPSTLGATNQFMNQGGNYAANAGPQLFSLNTPYAQDLFSSNQNAIAAANISGANARAGMLGAGIGLLGNLGGGYLAGR